MRGSNFLKQTAAIMAVLFFTNSVLPSAAMAQALSTLPVPGTMVGVSLPLVPSVLKGIKVDLKNPFVFDFILDKGGSGLEGEALSNEGRKLINYFLTAMTVPEKETWVNLSPYEQNRIIPDGLGQTVMGRDMLSQDYLLKQLTASLVYPETDLGAQFWAKVYAQARAKLDTSDIPMDSFNKVWIMPDKIALYETGNGVYIVKHTLKVLTEQDYLATASNKVTAPEISDGAVKTVNDVATRVMREVVIPAITKEVNEGTTFAPLRQIYDSLLLAAWYKSKVKDSIFSATFADKNKVSGNLLEDQTEKTRLYDQYVAAFKKGVYNYIKEDVDEVSQEVIPRKYFSGGLEGVTRADLAQATRVSFNQVSGRDGAQVTNLYAIRTDINVVDAAAVVTKPNVNELAGNFKAVASLKNRMVKKIKVSERKLLDVSPVVEDRARNFLLKSKILDVPTKEVQYQSVHNGVLGGVGYAFDRESGVLLVSDDLIDLGKEILGSVDNVLAVLTVEFLSDERMAYEFIRDEILGKNKTAEMFADSPGWLPENLNRNVDLAFPLKGGETYADLQPMIEMLTGSKFKPVNYEQIKNRIVGKDVVAVHNEVKNMISDAGYSMALRVMLGLLEIKAPDTVEGLSALFLAGKKLIVVFNPSKYSPPTGAHDGFWFKIPGLVAGLQMGKKVERQTLVIMPNVTKDDTRKRLTSLTYDDRYEMTSSTVDALSQGAIKVLHPHAIFAPKNGEEAIVEITVRLLIDLVNTQGAHIQAPQKPGQITHQLIEQIREFLPDEILLRNLYQAGTDHNVVFKLQKYQDGFVVAFKDVKTVDDREDQLFWARLDPVMYKNKIVLAHPWINAEGLSDFDRRSAFLKSLQEAKLPEDVLKVIEEADYLPLLDTAGKEAITGVLFSKVVDHVFVHTFRPDDYFPDPLRDELNNTKILQTLNVDGFQSQVSATLVRDGVRTAYITGEITDNLLLIAVPTARALFKNSKTGELLLRQDINYVTGQPKTYFPATPEVAILSAFDSNPEHHVAVEAKKKQAMAAAGISAGELTTVMTSDFQTQLTIGNTSITYEIGIMYREADGAKINTYAERAASPNGEEAVLAKLRVYAKTLNDTDAAESIEEIKALNKEVVQGGIDFDTTNVDLNIQSEGAGIKFKIDPAMIQRGEFNGLVPVIRSITPVTNVPLFLGANVNAPALTGATG